MSLTAGEVRRVEEPIPGRYIVRLANHVTDVERAAAAIAVAHNGRVLAVWKHAIRGFWLEMPEASLASLADDPRVARVEQDSPMHGASQAPSMRADDDPPTAANLWHLRRLGYRKLEDGTESVPGSANSGTGVRVYIIDTGVWKLHEEFAGATIEAGANIANAPYVDRDGIYPEPVALDTSITTAPCGNRFPLFNQAFHGTATASMIVGKTVGVAKGATLIAVSENSCTDVAGTLETRATAALLIGSLDWVLQDAVSYANVKKVVSLSVYKAIAGDPDGSAKCKPGGDCVGTADLNELERAVQKLIDAGITVIASANNKQIDSCLMSPARLSRRGGAEVDQKKGRVITVGGIDSSDERFTGGDALNPGSNYGQCVDIFAPAKDVTVASTSGNTDYKSMSGTSFSAPLVAGIAARLLAEDPTLTVDALWKRMTINATPMLPLKHGLGSPHLLAYLGGITFKTQAPSQKAVAANEQLRLSVSIVAPVSGSVTYAWYRGTESAVLGTSADLVLNPPHVAGNYRVRVTHTVGQQMYFADSNDTSVTIGCPLPEFVEGPESSWNKISGSVTLKAKVRIPLNTSVVYRWEQLTRPPGQSDIVKTVVHSGTLTGTASVPEPVAQYVASITSQPAYYRIVLVPPSCSGGALEVASDSAQVRATYTLPPAPSVIVSQNNGTVLAAGEYDPQALLRWYYAPDVSSPFTPLIVGCNPLSEPCTYPLSSEERKAANGGTWLTFADVTLRPPLPGRYYVGAINAAGVNPAPADVPADKITEISAGDCGTHEFSGRIGSEYYRPGEIVGKPGTNVVLDVKVGVYTQVDPTGLRLRWLPGGTGPEQDFPADGKISLPIANAAPNSVFTAIAVDKRRGCERRFTFRFPGDACLFEVKREILSPTALRPENLSESQSFRVATGSIVRLRALVANTIQSPAFVWKNDQGQIVAPGDGDHASERTVKITGNMTITADVTVPGCTAVKRVTWTFETKCDFQMVGLLQDGHCGRSENGSLVVSGALYRYARLSAELTDTNGVRLAEVADPPGSSSFLPINFVYVWTVIRRDASGQVTERVPLEVTAAVYEQRIESQPVEVELSISAGGSCPSRTITFIVQQAENLVAPSQCITSERCSYVCGRRRAVWHNGWPKTVVSFAAGGEVAVLSAPEETLPSTYTWYRRVGTMEMVIGSGASITVTLDQPAEYYVVTSNADGTDISYHLVVHEEESDIRVEVAPTSKTITVGQSVTFTASLPGANPATTQYEWRSGTSYQYLSSPIIGRSATLNLYGVQDLSTFWCRVVENPGTPQERISKSPFVVVFVECGNGLNGVAIARPDRVAAGQKSMLLPATNGRLTTYTWSRSTDNDPAPVVFSDKQNPTPVVTDPVTYFTATAVDVCDQTASIGPATVYLCIPTITAQPASVVGSAIQPPVLSVSATPAYDGQSMSVKWYRSSDVAMTTSLGTGWSFTPSMDVETSDSFYAAITTTCGSQPNVVRTQPAMVQVCAAPQITVPIPEYWTGRGQQIDVQVFDSNPSDDHTYQWYVGQSGDTSAPMGGQTSRSLRVQPLTTGHYWCRATSRGLCTTDSQTITVEVCALPTITAQPQGAVLFPGQSKLLSVTATTTIPQPFAYQWQRLEGAQWVDIAGATAGTYTTPGFTVTQQYRAIVWAGDICDVISDVAVISGCRNPQSISVPEVKIAQGASASLSLPVMQPATRNITWYRGAVGDRNTPVKSGSGSNLTYQTPPLTETTYYWAEFTEVDDGCVSQTGPVKVNVCEPTITAQPVGKTIPGGTSATLSVAAIPASAGLTYQWFVGQPGTTTTTVPNGTGTSVTVSPASTTTYWVRVTSECGRAAHSEAVTVVVCNAPQISSQTPSRSIEAGASTSLSVLATGSNLTYQWYQGTAGVTTSPIPDATSDSVVVHPNTNTSYWCRITSEGTCPKDSATIPVSVCTVPSIATQPASRVIFSGTSTTLEVVASSSSGLTYQWYTGPRGSVQSPVSGATSNTLSASPTAATTYWCRITTGVCSVDSAAATISLCANPATVAALVPDQTIASGQRVTLQLPVMQPTADPKATTWYKGAMDDRSTPVASGTAVRLDYQTPVLTANAQYWAEFTHNGCLSKTATYTIRVCRPTITADPQGTAVTAGSPATFSVAATGSPLTYQWYRGATGDTTQPVSGGTLGSVTVTPTATTSYWVRVSGCTTADSAAATVTVCAAPTVSAVDRSAETRPAWQGYVAVTANGVALTYQWYYGQSGDTSRPVAGATAATYTFTLQTSEYYWVRVTSGCSGAHADSAAALYSVQPRIPTQPQGGPVLCAGDTGTYSVVATGNFLTYQWYRKVGAGGWDLLPGATNSSLTIAVAEATRFKVTVSSGPTNITSNEAVPTVNPRPVITRIAKTYVSSTRDRLLAELPQADLDAGPTFAWYRGPLGTTTNYVGGTQSINVTPTHPDSYWVRVTFTTGCSTDAGYTYQ